MRDGAPSRRLYASQALLSTLLIAFVSLAGCTNREEPPEAQRAESSTQTPQQQPSHCRVTTELSLEPVVKLEPDPGIGPARAVWQGDLNADGLTDLLIRFPEGCGNYGDCPYAIYVACGGDESSFGPVWGPAYSFDLAVDATGPVTESGWSSLLDTQREGNEVSVRRLGFDGERYAIVELLDD